LDDVYRDPKIITLSLKKIPIRKKPTAEDEGQSDRSDYSSYSEDTESDFESD